MSEIIKIENVNGKLLVSSREVADNFDKDHKNIIRTIDNLIKEDSSILSHGMFVISSYRNSNNRIFKEYFMTRDGFSLLVMGFTGAKALNWKLKYIEAFNQMEQELRNKNNPYEGLSNELKAIFMVDKKQQELENRVTEVKSEFETFRDNAPLFNSECDELIKVVKKIATKTLGGYKSNAYKDKSVRTKVYSDIQHQIRREFGVTSYKAIKRCQLHIAKNLVENYEAPIVLEEEIELLNNQLALA